MRLLIPALLCALLIASCGGGSTTAAPAPAPVLADLKPTAPRPDGTPTPRAVGGDALPDRPVSQALVPEAVAAQRLARYLSDPRAAAPKDEVVVRPPWESMGRYPQNPAPFGAVVPSIIRQNELPAHDDIRALTALVEDERWAEAEAVARRRLESDPTEAQARALLGWSLTELDRMDEAEAVLEELLRQFPGYLDGWVELGILRSNDRRVEGSVDAFDHALALQDVWEARLGRGIALCRADRFEQAEYDLWKAVQLSPQDGNAYYDLAWIAAQRRDAKLSAYLLRFAAREPRLLAVRVCRRVLLDDTYFEPVWHDPVFEAYLEHLPATCLVQEHNSPLTPTIPGQGGG
jgi:tetratricopeptide (TPR) repeat protein